MGYLLVTLQYGETIEDLKVPGFVPVGELITTFGEVFETNGAVLHAEPQGIILNKAKTLGDQGVAHGALLTLE